MIDRQTTALIRPALARLALLLVRRGIGADAAMCVWTPHFAALAFPCAARCTVTVVTHIVWGWQAFRPDLEPGTEP